MARNEAFKAFGPSVAAADFPTDTQLRVLISVITRCGRACMVDYAPLLPGPAVHALTDSYKTPFHATMTLPNRRKLFAFPAQLGNFFSISLLFYVKLLFFPSNLF